MANDRMMVTKAKIDRIGDAIREKTGSGDTYTLDEMPEAIRAIQTGGGGIGAQVTVTTTSPILYGKQVTITDGEKSLSKTFSNLGICIFDNVDFEGNLLIYSEIDGERISTNINVTSHYTVSLDVYKTYTLRIDLTDSNPETWGQWINCSVTETPVGHGENEIDTFMAYYPVVLDKNGLEKVKVNPSNYKQDINGNQLSFEEYDSVMVAFPTRGFKISKPDATHMDFAITDDPNKTGFTYLKYRTSRVNTLYIGAYETSDSQRYLSRSNGTPFATGNSFSTDYDKHMEDAIHGGGRVAEYNALTFNEMRYIQCCALIKYKGKDIRRVLGRGVFGGSPLLDTGRLDENGLNYGNPNTSSETVKLFGVENLYGNMLTSLAGVKTQYDSADDAYNLYTSDLWYSLPNQQYVYDLIGPITEGNRYIFYPVGETAFGFFPAAEAAPNGDSGLCAWCETTATTYYIGGSHSWQSGSLFRLTNSNLLSEPYQPRLTSHSLND